jgi:predicted GIY-YIG superfamily endonuclease
MVSLKTMGVMPAAQTLLFPDPQPLVERLGREFFRQLPEGPGVYLMRDANDAVLYVGKAKSLRKRLGSYRVANPDRMARRHLRMLRAVVRIELQECADELAALEREAELLRSLKPRFNRAGTWRPAPRFLAWRSIDERLELSVADTPESGWKSHGPLGSGAVALQAVLVRLMWYAIHPERGVVGLPLGWAHGKVESNTAILCGQMVEEVMTVLEGLFTGRADVFGDWLRARMPADTPPFGRAAVEADLESLMDFAAFRATEALQRHGVGVETSPCDS